MPTAPPGFDWPTLLRLIPGYDPYRDADGCWFDPDEAAKAIGFIERHLRHVEGAEAGKRFRLEPWQRAIVANLFGWLQKDSRGRVVRRYRQCLLYVPRKNGKAIDIDTPIPTPTGWARMGDLKAGDEVFDECGRVCRVVRAFPVMHGNPCYRVRFSDGSEVVADAEHLWTVHDRHRDGRAVTITTDEIARTFRVGNRATHRERRYTLPPARSLQLPPADLPIDPYTLGVWLGDGNSGDARITVGEADAELITHLEACGTAVARRRADTRSSAARYLLGSFGRGAGRGRSFQAALRAAGLLGNKHIPAPYLRGSEAQRMALLQGLMDTDGYCSKAGQCEFTTTSPALRDGFLELARGLGFKPTLKTARATVYGKDCGEKYRIQFWAFQDRPVFRLTRKAARLKPAPEGPTRSTTRQVVAVEPVASVPVRCIAVDSPSRLYLAGRGMVPTHNTPLAAAIGLYVLYCDPEIGQQDYIAASAKEQAGFLFRQARGMVERNQDLAKRVRVYGGNAGDGLTKSLVKHADGSFLKVISSDGNTKHGGNSHLVIIDELHAQHDRELVDVLQTSFASDNRPQPLFLMITTADFNRPSICNEKHSYACKVRDGVIRDARFLPVVYELATDESWEDERNWAKANPNLGVSVSLDYLRAEALKAKDSPSYRNTFRRLHLNQKTETSETWLPMDLWDRCAGAVDLDALRGRDCWAGLDFGWRDDLAALVLVFPVDRPDGATEYQAVCRFWLPENGRRERQKDPIATLIADGLVEVTPGGSTDMKAIYAALAEYQGTYNVRAVMLDPANARAQGQHLMDEGFDVVEFQQAKRTYTEPCRALEQMLTDGTLRHGGNACLRWMAANAAAETNGLGHVMPAKRKSADKIDGICALLMALGECIKAPAETPINSKPLIM